MDVIYFLRRICKKNTFLNPETMSVKKQANVLKESIQGGKAVKNLQKFWMNKK